MFQPWNAERAGQPAATALGLVLPMPEREEEA
jgi:hypothetical protein